jgi:hypothetical protein
MNTYQFRINNSEKEMQMALDVQGYSHMTPEHYEQRFVVFSAHNYREATVFIMAAMGQTYRKGFHVPFLK